MNKKTKRTVITLLVLAAILGLGGVGAAYYYSTLEDTGPQDSQASPDQYCGVPIVKRVDGGSNCPTESAQLSTVNDVLSMQVGTFNSDNQCSVSGSGEDFPEACVDSSGNSVDCIDAIEVCSTIEWEDSYICENLYLTDSEGNRIIPPLESGDRLVINGNFENSDNVSSFSFLSGPDTLYEVAKSELPECTGDFCFVQSEEVEIPVLNAGVWVIEGVVNYDDGSSSTLNSFCQRRYTVTQESVESCTVEGVDPNPLLYNQYNDTWQSEDNIEEITISFNNLNSSVITSIGLGYEGIADYSELTGNLDIDASNLDATGSSFVLDSGEIQTMFDGITSEIDTDSAVFPIQFTLDGSLELEGGNTVICNQGNFSLDDLEPTDEGITIDSVIVQTSELSSPPVLLNNIILNLTLSDNSPATGDLVLTVFKNGSEYDTFSVEGLSLSERVEISDLSDLSALEQGEEDNSYVIRAELTVDGETLRRESATIIVEGAEDPDDPIVPDEIEVDPVTVSKSGTQCVERVTPNNTATFTVEIRNPNVGIVEKITSVKDKLPLGFTYVRGSTDITLNGLSITADTEPNISAVGSTQELVWQGTDGFDIESADKLIISFSALAGPQAISGNNQNEVIVNQLSNEQEIRTEYVFTVAQSCTAPETGLFDSVIVRISFGLLIILAGYLILAHEKGYSLALKFTDSKAGSDLISGVDRVRFNLLKVIQPRKYFEEKIKKMVEEQEDMDKDK